MVEMLSYINFKPLVFFRKIYWRTDKVFQQTRSRLGNAFMSKTGHAERPYKIRFLKKQSVFLALLNIAAYIYPPQQKPRLNLRATPYTCVLSLSSYQKFDHYTLFFDVPIMEWLRLKCFNHNEVTGNFILEKKYIKPNYMA